MAAPATRRIARGKGHSYVLDGEPVEGVTTILRDGIAKQNLVGWAARSVAGYAIDHWAELAEKTPSKRLAELSGAAWEERDAAAGRGTKVHELAQQLAAGLEVEVPEALIGHVDAYLAFAEAYRITELHTEIMVVNRKHRYAGTIDLLATIDDEPAIWLMDYKTGGSGIWPETALQLCAYAHAEHLIDATDGHEEPMPHIERAAAVWLRADGFDVYPVDISEQTFMVFLYAQQLARFTRADRSQYVHAALPPRQLEVAS